jgi:TetR/AcrR family transcriptional repressor of nem operon
MAAMNRPPGAAPDATRSRILDVAERLVQTRGFNGFSYADIAAEVGITKASLHYHFATKADLGCMLVLRYTEGFNAALAGIATGSRDAQQRLRDYVSLYTRVLADQRMCLCGMVAAEYGTLPPPMQDAIRAFFEVNESWLAAQIEHGMRAGRLSPRLSPRESARMLVGALEGEMLVARAYGDPARFETAARLLLVQLNDGASAPQARRARKPVRRTGARPRAAHRSG